MIILFKLTQMPLVFYSHILDSDLLLYHHFLKDNSFASNLPGLSLFSGFLNDGCVSKDIISRVVTASLSVADSLMQPLTDFLVNH